MTTHHADAIATARWLLDPARSRLEFRVPTLWGLTRVTGSFSRYRGTLDLGARPAIELTVAGASLDTSNKRRDRHLRSAAFLDVEEHPEICFVSETAALDGERLTIQGRLHAKGTSMPLSLEATLRDLGDRLEVEAAAEADHRTLGITWNTLGLVGTPSRLTLKGVLVRDGD
jgi:polyisoprenoid-binding protein YceI